MAEDLKRWHGLQMLVQDAVEHGSHAVERVQKDTARVPFAVLEAIPGVEAPAAAVHAAYDLAVGATHGAIRLANQALGAVLSAWLGRDTDEPGDR